MVTSYKKVGVDIAAIKKSQKTIGRMISSTHKIQKLAKVDAWFWTLCWNSSNTWKQIFGYTYGWSGYKDHDCKHDEKI